MKRFANMTTTQIIAKEGFLGVLILGFIFLFSLKYGLGFVSGVSFVGFVMWVWAFRNPERPIWHKDQNAIYSMMDGILRDIKVDEKYRILQVENRLFDNGILRSPCNVKNTTLSTIHGLNLYFASKDKKHLLNKKVTLSAKEFKLEIFQEIFNFKGIYHDGDFELGERIGFIKPGWAKIYLPKNTFFQVEIGDKLKTLHTIIAPKSKSKSKNEK